jgi:FixJ family two-component response regulator
MPYREIILFLELSLPLVVGQGIQAVLVETTTAVPVVVLTDIHRGLAFLGRVMRVGRLQAVLAVVVALALLD